MSESMFMFPYSESAKVHLSQRAAQRLFHLRDRTWDREQYDQRKPVYELTAYRVALLPGGWVRVYTGFDYSADKRLMRDLLLAPGEVIAIESGWDSGEGPGSTRVGRVRPVKERWDLWLASWRGAEAPSDDEV